jgi:type IV secretory pathway VirB2 component (pilin)
MLNRLFDFLIIAFIIGAICYILAVVLSPTAAAAQTQPEPAPNLPPVLQGTSVTTDAVVSTVVLGTILAIGTGSDGASTSTTTTGN